MTVVLFALSTLVGGVAFAETPGVSVQLEQSSTTSPKEKVEFTEAAIAEIGSAVKTVERLLEDAQKEKNTEQIECLTRKLTPLRSLYEVSRQSNTTMQQALAANDAVHADQEFRKVAVALTKSKDFLAEAQACVGEAGAKPGETAYNVNEGGEALASEDDLVEEGDSWVPDDELITPR